MDSVWCIKCGRHDDDYKDAYGIRHKGTDINMKCSACNNGVKTGQAQMCRKCCPTGHGTREEE